MVTRPTGLVIGPMKSGTSWIQAYMENRRDVVLPDRVKETFFFDHYWYRGLGWYEQFFERGNSSEMAFCLEVGSSYFHSIDAPQRIEQALGLIPILVTLRDPVRRAWSHYLHLRRYGFTRAELRNAVKQFPEIVEASRYRTCLQRWHAVFPKENIRFVWLDTLKSNPDAYAQAVCKALGLPYQPVPEAMAGANNQAAVPSSYWLAVAGSAVTRSLRHVGLYSVVNGAKRLGLKRLFYGKPGSGSGIQPTAKERAWLEAQLADELTPELEALRQ